LKGYNLILEEKNYFIVNEDLKSVYQNLPW